MCGLGKAIFCRISYFAAPRHLPFYTRWSFVPASPARGEEKGQEARVKGHPGCRQGGLVTPRVSGLSPCPPCSCSPPTAIHLSFKHCFVKESEISTPPNPILQLLPASPMAMRHYLEFPPHYSYIAFSPLIKRQHLQLLPDYRPELLVCLPGSLFTFPLIFNLQSPL